MPILFNLGVALFWQTIIIRSDGSVHKTAICTALSLWYNLIFTHPLMSLVSSWKKLLIVEECFVFVIENNLREVQEVLLVMWTLNLAIFSHINNCCTRYCELLVFHPLVWCVYDFKIWQVLCVYSCGRYANCSSWSNNFYDTSWILMLLQPKITDCGRILDFFHPLARFWSVYDFNISQVFYSVPLSLTCKM